MEPLVFRHDAGAAGGPYVQQPAHVSQRGRGAGAWLGPRCRRNSCSMREKFSVSHFWSDILRWDCTLFQYIGEMCRYLLHAAPSVWETEHSIRLACGNGLAPEVWDGFQDRFRIPRILEFYAATEGGVSLFNVQGKRGAIGHIPRYLAHRFSPALVRFDFETGEPARDEHGFCIRCGPNQPGEALGKVVNDPANIGSHFEGYLSKEASEQRILRNVFEIGDAWARTGDLMRTDEKGFFYFVDRIGDTFRRKGENVATSEIAAIICAVSGNHTRPRLRYCRPGHRRTGWHGHPGTFQQARSG